MIIPQQFVETALPVHPNDPNKYITVRRDSVKVAGAIRAKDLYNPLTNLSEHPVSKNAIDCIRIIEKYFNIPVKLENIAGPIGCTYRNHPCEKPSVHQLGQAIIFTFKVDEVIERELFLLIREDWKAKGDLFQQLWSNSCRGFLVTDTFLRIDTLEAELYPSFAAIRRDTYQSKKYLFLDKTKILKYLSPSYYGLLPNKLSDQPSDFPLVKRTIPVETDFPNKDILEIAQAMILATIGSFVGFVQELTQPDLEWLDKYRDTDERNISYAFFFVFFTILFFTLFLV